MGAWGEGPCDNDTAADWFYNLRKIGLFNVIEAGLNSDNYAEARAAAWLVQQLGRGFVYDINVLDNHIGLAIDTLTEMLNNDSYINQWSDRVRIKDELMSQIESLKSLRKR